MPFLRLLGLLTHMLLTNVQLAMGLAMVEPLSAMLVLLLLHPMATTVIAPHLTLAMVTVTMAFAMVTVPIAMVMMAAPTVRCIPSSNWLFFSLRLYLYHPVALCWDLCALIRAVPTDALAVGLLNGVLYVGSTQDGKREEDMMGQTTTPVIDEEVILLSSQGLPHVSLFGLLFVQYDVLRQFLAQQGVKVLGLVPLVVHHHIGHIVQTLALQLQAQLIQ